MTSVVDRFIKYAKVYTTSEYDTGTFPSTARQFDLAKLLVKEMKDMGMQDVELDGKGYIYATLPANTPEKIPTIGLIAHMDTSPEAPGENVSPQIVRNYDGGEIVLNKKLNMVLSPRDFPELLKYVDQDIITSDGTTLLGADDKAGIAVILSAMEYLIQHPESKHGRIRIGFTPDEEIGHGADFFDVKKFDADFAYTVDGGELGELEYECFNACMVKVHIQGRSVHPGSAKNQMINAIELAHRFHGLLPAAERPEYTEKYEGFYHLYQVNAEVEEATLIYIIRDHDRNIYEKRKAVFMKAVDYVNQVAGTDRIKVELIEQYQNMKEVILPKMHVVDTAKQAMEELEIIPKIGPIRGGTDGARLSYQGLPTPNLFAGGHNFHGKYEYLPIPSLEKSVQVVLKVLSLYAENPKF